MSDLEKQFNLGEANPDRGGGILYCMRYNREHIEEHHAQVVKALERMGITFQDAGDDGIAVKPEQPLGEDQERVMLGLLEELSVINEAREYKEGGLDGVKNISELCDSLMLSFYNLLKERNLPDAYNFITLFVPAVIRDLRIADAQNKVLSNKDQAAIEKLVTFVKSKEKLLNSPRGFSVMT